MSPLTESNSEEVRLRLVRGLAMRWGERMGVHNTPTESVERLVDEVIDLLGEMGYVIAEIDDGNVLS